MKNTVITASLITLCTMVITDISTAMNSRNMQQNRAPQQYQEAYNGGGEEMSEDEGYQQPKKKKKHKKNKNKNKSKKNKKQKDYYKIQKVEAEQLVQKCPCAKEFVDKLKNDELQTQQQRNQEMPMDGEEVGNFTGGSNNTGNNYRQNNNRYRQQQPSSARGGNFTKIDNNNSINSWKDKIDAKSSKQKEDASSIRIELKPITTVAVDQRRLDSIINRKPLDDASSQVFASNNTNDELAALLRKTKLSIGRQDVSLHGTREMNNLKKDLEKYRQKFA